MSCVKVESRIAHNSTPRQMTYSAHNHSWPSSSRPTLSPVVPQSTYAPPHNHQRATKSASEIIPRLYISDLSFAESPSCLASYGITHVVSAISGSVILPHESTLYPHSAPRHLHVRLDDFPFAELAAHLPMTTAWIRDAYRSNPNARILVHCAEGVSRSVSVVAAFLIAQYGWTPMEAVQYIKSKRRVADPNFGFIQQLGEYARSLSRS